MCCHRLADRFHAFVHVSVLRVAVALLKNLFFYEDGTRLALTVSGTRSLIANHFSAKASRLFSSTALMS